MDGSQKVGEFGDSRHDAMLTSYSLTLSKGLDENDFWVGSVDIVTTKKEIGVFTSVSTLNPIACEKACLNPKGKTSFIVPGINITKTKAFIWSDEIGNDVTMYQGGSSVVGFGGGGPVGYSVVGFSSTDSETGKRNNKVVGMGVSGGLSLGLDPSISSYYTWAKPIKIFKKPWVSQE